jgi:hypothetical protein
MTDKINMKEIKEIRSQIGQLQQKLRDARKRLEQEALKGLGLSVGDRIKTPRGLVEVTGCEVFSNTISLYGVEVKKDGTTGTQSAGYIGPDEWERVE